MERLYRYTTEAPDEADTLISMSKVVHLHRSPLAMRPAARASHKMSVPLNSKAT